MLFRSDVYVKTSVDVAMHNVSAMLYELDEGIPMEEAEVDLPPHPLAQTEEELAKTEEELLRQKEQEDEEEEGDVESCAAAVDMQLILQGMDVKALCKKQAYQSYFDVIMIGNGLAGILDDDECPLPSLLRPGGLVVVETCKFMLELKAEQRGEFDKKVRGFMAEKQAPLAEVSGRVSPEASTAYMLFQLPSKSG